MVDGNIYVSGVESLLKREVAEEVRVKVSYLHMIAKEVGVREEYVDVDDGSSLKVLVKRLAEKHEDGFSKYIYSIKEDEVKRHALILLNGNIIRGRDVERVTLREGDSVFFGVAAAGG